jgi:hypothetical protein
MPLTSSVALGSLALRAQETNVDADGLIDALGYSQSPNFLGIDRWHVAVEHAHGLRHLGAVYSGDRGMGRFHGVYMLGVSRGAGRSATTPAVLVFAAPDERAADEIHRVAWNQGTTPFVIVHTPAGVRVYSGFDYEPADPDHGQTSQGGVLEACVAFHQVADRLEAFRARSIDDGTIWARWGKRVDASKRVDVRLLAELRRLGDWLVKKAELEPSVAHALIGRFVYLRYLRERGLLSDARIAGWDLDPSEVFGRTIKLRSFHALIDGVDDWLNGSIFPMPKAGPRAPRANDVQRVAGVMLGDEVDGQLHLSFRAYDFSHIPIELLSSIYEQFIAGEGRDEESGAYYTPIPLVNFVLGELDDMAPLREGMRVLDPSCGSGAFLVQCYQLLVERTRQRLGRALTPRELRDVLVKHIFGLDREEGACRVTEFSLALALLDQIPTETLSRAHNFKLPSLHGANIVHGDFFDTLGAWAAEGFDWIVGNPPWFKASARIPAHGPALKWINAHAKTAPVCGQQIAEAFLWKASEHLRAEARGMIALIVPAMTLFESQRTFREAFFARMAVPTVANFSNLREVLFGGRARLPAAVLFYGPRDMSSANDVAVYSPMLLNQQANRPHAEGDRQPIWSITINHGEVKFLRSSEIEGGDPLPWKTCMWGSHRDLRLLRDIARRFPTLEKFAKNRWTISEGVQLKTLEIGQKGHTHQPDLVGRTRLEVKSLNAVESIHSFGRFSRKPLRFDDVWLRERGGARGLSVNAPPHVVVSAARTFAVFSDEYLVVPPRQIGIAGPGEDSDLLRVLALYLGSTFARYHQFMHSPQMGVRGGRSTLEVLLQIPFPFESLDAVSRAKWSALHRELVEFSDERWRILEEHPDLDLARWRGTHTLQGLEHRVDQLVADALGLHPHERWLVEDLVHVRSALVDSKVGDAAARCPERFEIASYAQALRDTLDLWLDRGERFRHRVTVVHGAPAGVVQIEFENSPQPHPCVVEAADSEAGRALRAVRERLEAQPPQWLYFDRNLVMYLDGRVFLFKPMQRVSWTRSQALADADRIIADLVAAGAMAS